MTLDNIKEDTNLKITANDQKRTTEIINLKDGLEYLALTEGKISMDKQTVVYVA